MARSNSISAAEAHRETAITHVPTAITHVPAFPEMRFETGEDFLNAYKILFTLKNDCARDLHRICYSLPDDERVPYIVALERFFNNSLCAIEKAKAAGIIPIGDPEDSGPIEVNWNL